MTDDKTAVSRTEPPKALEQVPHLINAFWWFVFGLVELICSASADGHGDHRARNAFLALGVMSIAMGARNALSRRVR